MMRTYRWCLPAPGALPGEHKETFGDLIDAWRLHWGRLRWYNKLANILLIALLVYFFGGILFFAVVDTSCMTASYVYHEYFDSFWYVHMSWSDHADWWRRGPDATPLTWRQGQ